MALSEYPRLRIRPVKDISETDKNRIERDLPESELALLLGRKDQDDAALCLRLLREYR